MSNRKFWLVVAVLAAMLAYGGAGQTGEQYSVRSLKGAYGFSGSGTLVVAIPDETPQDGGIVVSGQAATVGVTTFDGMGGCVATARLTAPALAAALSVPHAPFPLNATVCSYKVNSDGTGTQTLTFPIGDLNGDGKVEVLDIASDFVIVQGNKEVHFMLSDANGTVASGVSKKQAGGDD